MHILVYDAIHLLVCDMSCLTQLALPLAQLCVLALDGGCCCSKRLVLKHVIQLLSNLFG